MKRFNWLIHSCMLGCQVLLAVPALAATIYVPTLPDIAQIQDGIDVAQNGDTVIVADGLRIERINFNGKLITLRSANGPARCIIDGMNGGCVVTFSKGETDQARLEGFTIQYGRSTGGGGIHIESKSSPIIANCVITNCLTEHYGGGVHIYNSSPTLTNCIISGNYGGHGGAVSIQYHSSPRIINCDLSQNTANEGGAIASYGSEPTITGCSILQNLTVVADSGEGGGILISTGAPKISHCTIADNYSAMNGGGVSCFNSLLTFDQCVISGNRAYYTGGGIAVNNGAPSFTRCLISGNRNYYGGGGLDIKYASPKIANCIISGNSTTTTPGGGGINCIEAFPAVVNCTIAGNSAADGHGGGIESSDSVPDVVNTIVWGNSPTQIGVHDSIFYPNREPVVSYCDVEGSYVGTANLNADPLFVNLAIGDFHLQAASPCIDTGAIAKAPDDDIEGTARPQDGNADGLAIVDMGAYEVAGPLELLIGFLLDPADPNYIPDSAFRNPTNQVELASKLQSVVQMIQRDEHHRALENLQNDVLQNVDGCAATGAPDPDDWIVDCQHQTLAYQRVLRAIAGLLPLVRASGSLQVAVAQGYCWIGLPTEPASTYQLQCSTNLSSWDTLVANIPGTGDYYQVLDPAPVTSQGMRCYRAVQFFGPAPGEPAGNPDPAAWAWVSPGSFAMGSGANSAGSESDEKPATLVVLTNGFWAQRFEATQQEYLELIGSNPAWFVGDTSRPVEYVSYSEARNYCALLTAREQAAGRLPAGYTYRLPTEAEWEYACRAGSTTEFCYGDDPTGGELGYYAWLWDNSGSTNMPPGYSYYMGGKYYTTQPVGTRQMNRWGLSDMHGSIWEWCLDWYATYPGGTVTNYLGASNGTSRVIRGGSWNGGPGTCRSANRSAAFPDGRSSGVGFRAILAR